MKKIALIIKFLLITFLSSAQWNGPVVEWKYHDIPPNVVNSPVVQAVTGSGQTPGATLTFDESGEDWWYDIENIYESGEHVGYMVCGFATWKNIDFVYGVNGCPDQLSVGLSCTRPVLTDEKLSEKMSTVAKYDLKGNMIWCKAYCQGNEGAIALTPSTDGGFAFTGWGKFSRDLQGNPVFYNPDGITFNDPAVIGCADLDRKMFVCKIDGDGNQEWLYTYGIGDIDGSNDDDDLAAWSLGYDLVETDIPNNFRVVGSSFDTNDLLDMNVPSSAYTKIFVVDVDANGYILNKQLFGSAATYSDAREILKSGSNYYISGFQIPGTNSLFGGDRDGLIFKIDNNMVQQSFGQEVWGANNAAIRFSTGGDVDGWDVKELNNGKIAWGILEDCYQCGPMQETYKRGKVFLFEDSGDASPDGATVIDVTSVNTYGFESFKAFDMKLGLTSTSDGGFAFLSTYQVFEPDPNSPPYSSILTDLDNQFGTYDCSNNFDLSNANTNAYVAKFDADGNLLWDKSIDADDSPIANYPGDWKEQECVYRITEAQDGSLVFVGNTSHNKDDYYIAKIASDCPYQKELAGGYDLDLIISTDFYGTTTWSGADMSVTGTAVVKNDAVLIIDGITVEFADSRKMPYPTRIIVEPGGELRLINGAVLTSLSDCENTMWDGVQVWGNSSAPQDPEVQGLLTMNNAEINNAVIGVAAVKRDGFTKNLAFTGGILKVQNSTFRNNLISVEMRPYEYDDGNGIVDQASFFNNNDFIIDAPLNDAEYASTSQDLNAINGTRYTAPRAHQEFILLDGIRGLYIRGNDFLLDNSVPYVANIEQKWRGYGILSWDSEYNVKSLSAVINDPNPKPNTFKNLNIGVYAKPMGGINQVIVDDNEFSGNHFGVAFEGTADFSRVTSNTFDVPGAGPSVSFAEGNAGVYAFRAGGIKIEDNEFTGGNIIGFNSNCGVYVDGSNVGGGSAEVYKNEFDELIVGTQSATNNANLTVDCNDFTKHTIEDDIAWHNVPGGLVLDQGFCPPPNTDPEAPQSNVFSGAYSGASMTVLNQGNFFEYSRFSDAQFIPTNGFGFLDDDCLQNDPGSFQSCPVRNAPPDFPVVGIQINDLVNELVLLEGLIDDGDTEGLVDFVTITSAPYLIRNELLTVAPYLSDEVLITMINKASMPAWVVNQVLTANEVSSTKVLTALINSANNYPDWLIKNHINSSSPVDETVLVSAINRTEVLAPWVINSILVENSPLVDQTLITVLNAASPLPNYAVRNVLKINTPLDASVDNIFQANGYPNWVYNQVYNSGVIADDPSTKVPPSSAMSDLKAEMNYKTSLKSRQVDYLVTYYLDDNKIEDAALLLEAQNSTEGSCQILPLLLSTKQGTRLYQHIQTIRDDADQDPTSPRSQNLYAYCDFYELMYQVRTQQGGIDAITPAQLGKLQFEAEENTGIAVNYGNVLQYIEAREINDLFMQPVNFGSIQKSAFVPESAENKVKEEVQSSIEFTLYPNPAQTEVHIIYDINDLSEQSSLKLFDLSGKLIYQEILYDQHNELVLTLSAYQKGIYLINLTSDKGESITKKLIVN